ncbi:MAG: prephenate dehydrogenase/arogenate dehydrogenase family protein [Gemmatimonadaceae bacterium]|nr:prephenate dehydrogenase/arogenate dehydrogenase family protein [Gemmatimonadaceae bacterium]
MSPGNCVAVIGVGLVGGSVARSLAGRGVKVLGFDADQSTVAAALGERVLSLALPPDLSGIEEADAVVIAVPVDAAPAILGLVAARAKSARLITDVGSTKRTIVAAAESLGIGDRFVGAHPMAGDHRSGWPASRPDLVEGATVYLCPIKSTPPDVLEAAKNFWAAIGGKPKAIGAAEHDELVAWTSHMPHLLSSALALALAREGIARETLGQGGRDMTRLAGGSSELWTAIARDNSDSIASALSGIERELGVIRLSLTDVDGTALRKLLEGAAGWAATSAT